jgi:predicted Zn-dependent peptidase
MRPSLRDDDFNIEKNVIKEEIAMYKDLPHFEVMDQCRAKHFGENACGNSVLGTNESIDALKADQMREYFSRRYSPNNMVVACCGDVDFDAICELIEKKCGSWQRQDAGREISFSHGSGVSERIENKTLVREHICTMSAMVSMQDERRFAASLMATILGDDTGSRYFWALIDSAIAETACMQFESMDGVGAIYSYIRCAPENAELVMEKVNEIFADVTANGVTQDELDKACNKILSAMTIRCEQPMGRLTNLGFNWVYNGQYRSVADDVAAIKAVTVEQINELIAEFSPGKFTKVSVGP